MRRIRVWAAVGLFLAVGASAGETSVATDAVDLEAAGLSDVRAVAQDGSRFAPPVRYFRSSAALTAAEAKKDCPGCADLIAAYGAIVAVPPTWAFEPNQRVRKFGARWQVREYVIAARRVVIATAPTQAAAEAAVVALKSKP